MLRQSNLKLNPAAQLTATICLVLNNEGELKRVALESLRDKLTQANTPNKALSYGIVARLMLRRYLNLPSAEAKQEIKAELESHWLNAFEQEAISDETWLVLGMLFAKNVKLDWLLTRIEIPEGNCFEQAAQCYVRCLRHEPKNSGIVRALALLILEQQIDISLSPHEPYFDALSREIASARQPRQINTVSQLSCIF